MNHAFGPTSTAACIFAAVLLGVAASPYDPHYPDFSLSWSEGYYARVVVDLDNSEAGAPASLGLVAGYIPRSRKGQNDSLLLVLVQQQQQQRQRLPGGVLQRDGASRAEGGRLQVWRDMGQDFELTSHGARITRDPDRASPPDFVMSSDSFRLEFRGDACLTMAGVGGLQLQLECAGQGQPYGPHGESPEGFLASWPTRLLGQHWYVLSLATPVRFSLMLPQADAPSKLVSGSGFAHFEKNWAEAFPAGWVWAQGLRIVNGSVAAAFVLAGGSMPLLPGPLAKEAWLLGVHVGKLSWRFHPWDPTLFSATSLPCAQDGGGTAFRFSARQATGREVEVTLTAPVASFAALECPTRGGFRRDSDHSYDAKATLRLYHRAPGSARVGGFRKSVLIYSGELPRAALEFGGDRRCSADAARPRRPDAWE